MSLQAAAFFAELCLPFPDHAVVGNTYYATPIPATPIRLRIDFTRTIHADTYGGLRLVVVDRDRGEIDAVALSFADHGTFHRRDEANNTRPNTKRHGTFDEHHRTGHPPWEGAVTTGLRDATEQYTGVWFPRAWTASAPKNPRGRIALTSPAAPVARHGGFAPAERRTSLPRLLLPARSPLVKTDPFHNLGPDQAVKVLPRYLAGPGTVDPRTAWPFPFDEGWAFAQAQDGTAAAFSPCLRLQATYEPCSTRKPKGAWTLSQHAAPFTPPDWRIVFDALTPAELVRDVHAELFDCYVDDRYKSKKDELFLGWPGKHEVYAHLFTQGWSHHVNTDGTQHFLAPDGLAGLRHRYDTTSSSEDGPQWQAWGGLPSQPSWKTSFSFGAPGALTAAFTASLASTEPLHRTVRDIPRDTRRALYLAGTTATQPAGTAPVVPPPSAPGRTR